MMLVRNLAVFAGVLMLTGSAALAEESNYNTVAFTAPSREEVIVTAPDIRVERNPVLGLPGKMSLTRHVSYSDLDLTRAGDAQELRARVRASAREICNTLVDAAPLREAPGTSCYGDAMKDAMIRVDRAIRDAKFDARYR